MNIFKALAGTIIAGGIVCAQAPAPGPTNSLPAKKSLLADDEGLPISPDIIEIIPQIQSGRISAISRRNEPTVCPVYFFLAGKWQLTQVQVLNAKEAATNKNAKALWHLISDSNSVPVKAFFYGERIRGMKPAMPRARPQPLLPDVEYVLKLESGSATGQTNFHTRVVREYPDSE